MVKKKNRKILFGPTTAIICITIFVMIITCLLSLLNVDSDKTLISNGGLETSIVAIKNIFSKEGLMYFFGNIMTNFKLLEPLTLLVLSLVCVGIGESSGLFKHIMQPLKKLSPRMITFLTILVGIISGQMGIYSYIIFLPLIGVLYKYLNRSSILGIVTMFLAITLGYGTGIFYSFDDYILGNLTQLSATLDVDQNYTYGLFSNFYIMLGTTLIIDLILTEFVEKVLVKKFKTVDEPKEFNISKTALKYTLVSLFVLLVVLIYMILPKMGGLLLDNNQELFIAKLFSDLAPFKEGLMYILLIIMMICGFIYGMISKNFKNINEYNWGLSSAFGKVGYMFVLLFFSSILIGVIEWTNFDVFIVTKILNLISIFELSGIALIIIAFIAIVIMTIFMPALITKWTLISPILVPLFMRANLTPDFTQFLFKMADGIGKSLSIFFIYYVVMLGFLQKYNKEEKSVDLMEIFKTILPIIIIIAVVILFTLICWHIVGLPIGIGTYTTL